jgi:aryl-alcohol dehydrogenase-like predicted oxidoreductase
MMEARWIQRLELSIPVVGLGSGRAFDARPAGQSGCDALVQAALRGGVRLFDTSPMCGQAEAVLARALGAVRADALVATRVWARDRAVGEQQVAAALRRFGHIDLLYVHNLLGLRDHLPHLQRLRARGALRGIGVSHYLPSAMADLLALVRERIVDVVQVPYHPLERSAEAELLAEARRLGVGVVTTMPFAGRDLLALAPPGEQLVPLRDFGVHSWPQVLLKWLLSDTRLSAVVVGTSCTRHIAENALAGQPPWFGPDERTYVRRLINARAGRTPSRWAARRAVQR